MRNVDLLVKQQSLCCRNWKDQKQGQPQHVEHRPGVQAADTRRRILEEICC